MSRVQGDYSLKLGLDPTLTIYIYLRLGIMYRNGLYTSKSKSTLFTNYIQVQQRGAKRKITERAKQNARAKV